MTNIRLLIAYLCLISAILAVNFVHAEKKIRVPLKRGDLPFNPCRTSVRMTAPLKKRIRKLTFYILSHCGLKVATLVNEKWGSLTDIPLIFPNLSKFVCLTFRSSYSFYMDGSGRLPARMAQNATDLYALTAKFYEARLKDTSVSVDLCGKDTRSGRVFCVLKEKILRVLELGQDCIQETLKNTIPEYPDASIYVFEVILDTLESNGFLQYVAG